MNSSSGAPRFSKTFLQPKYWPLWIGVGILQGLCQLPLRWLTAAGQRVGLLFGRLATSRRHVVATNLRLCFPELTAAENERRVDAHFRSLGAGIFETAAAWLSPDRNIASISEIHGLEHLRAAQAGDRGVLLLTGHFTTLEIAARILSRNGVYFQAMYRPIENPLLEYLMCRWREAMTHRAVLPKEDLRAIVRAMRRGEAIWYGPDQTLEAANAQFIPFFGVPALTLTATSRLAAMGHARVVPFFLEQRGPRYILTVQPALENFPSGDDTADALRVNQILETAVRLSPAAYFWIHRRFKYQPQGTPDVYATLA